MKTRRLPEIDLARIAPLPADQKRKALEQVHKGRPNLTYAPFRMNAPDILNVQPAMFGPAAHTDWVIVERSIQRASKSEAERKANLGVAKALHGYGAHHGIRARSQEFNKLSLSTGDKVEYWLNMVVALDEKPLIPFIDPRRGHGLTFEGRRFVFSMMHEQIRAADPDYANVSLGIIQFATGDNDERRPVLHLDAGVHLFDFYELDEMVRETQRLWLEVQEGREDDARRRGTGTRGSLL